MIKVNKYIKFTEGNWYKNVVSLDLDEEVNIDGLISSARYIKRNSIVTFYYNYNVVRYKVADLIFF